MDTMAKINQFRDERNWRPHHNEKDLPLSICLEAAELLELFQWKTAEEIRVNYVAATRAKNLLIWMNKVNRINKMESWE